MELKVVCQCGQKFKFDVEPVDGRMPFTVNCPVCNADGTAAANALLREHFASQPPPPQPPSPIVPPTGGLRLTRSSPSAQAAAPETVAVEHAAPGRIGAVRPPPAPAAAQKPGRTPNFGMGLLGGFLGALAGVIVYYLIFKFTGLRIRYLAIGVGALAGWCAEMLGKGEGSKELGGITAVFVLAGIIGAQYFVAMGWWHEAEQEGFKAAEAFYTSSVTEAKEAVKAVPTGSDAEIRAYLSKKSVEDGETVLPATISDDEVKNFRDNQLPEYRGLAGGQTTKEDFQKTYGLKTSMTKEEQQSEENTLKGVFLLLLLSKSNLFSLAAAAAVAFKLSTNA